MTEDTKPDSAPAAAEALIPDYLQTLLEQIAKREGFSDYKIISQSGSNIGDGFQGIMLSVIISGSRNDNDDDKLVLICKIPPQSELRRQMAAGPFIREINAYENLLPSLVEFQREMGVADNEGFFAFPKCYGTYSDMATLQFALVLEDLRETGYRMWDKFKPIDLKHVQLTLAQLGKYHAISFALRQQKPEVFEKFAAFKSSIFETISQFPQAISFYEKSFDRAIATLRPEDTEHVRKLTFLRNKALDKMGEAVSGETAEPYTVLCHGDFWNNNMMFRYSSADSLEPQQAMLIDWQMGQYCSPATDLAQYIYSSTEQPLRTAHFDDLLHAYHDNLAELLNRLGGNAAKQFSFDELNNQLNTYGIYGLIMAPIMVQIVTVKPDDLPDMDALTLENGDDFDFMGKGTADGYNVRISDVIRDFVDRGFFGEQHFKESEEK